MNVSQLKESKFLKRSDVGRGTLATIKEVTELNVAKEGAPQEFKWCVFFEEVEKPLVLNSTNGQAIATITGSDESDNWTGCKVVLYDDPNVSYGGKLVGGIRIRAPRNQPSRPAAAAPAPAPKPTPTTDVPAGPAGEPDDVPF